MHKSTTKPPYWAQGGFLLNYLVDGDRYYLNGEIKHSDLIIRNACGFDSLDQANAIAKSFGYKLSWEN